MAKCSIVIEWDSEEGDVMVIRKLNDVTVTEVLDVLDAVREEFVDAEWSEYVIS